MLDLDIIRVPSIGPSYASKLQKLGIEKVRDLIFHFPHRYQDYAQISSIDQAEEGEVVTIRGQIISIRNVFTRNGKKLQTAVVSDGNSRIDITWFNQTYLTKSLPEGTWVSLSGKVKTFGKKKSLVSPDWEKITPDVFWSEETGKTTHTGRLVPIYPETSGVSSKWIRNKIQQLLPELENEVQEFLPRDVLQENNFLDLQRAVKYIHFPENFEQAQKARIRFAFNEFFELQLNSLTRRENWNKRKIAHKLKIYPQDIEIFLETLPFELTNSQRKVIDEISQDLTKSQAMNRLLEGDVGSGKTVIAAYICYIAYKNGYQSSVMAPTQILASQHYKTLSGLLETLGIKVALVTALQSKKEKEEASGADVIVGTQALLHKIDFANMAVAVIDEQHRFGVAQRALLAIKGGSPHVLTMTATPIPRTVALTMYGDLDLSLLDEMPKGRLAIKTWVVPPKKRKNAYDWIRKHVKDTDEQAFIVCPLIEESEAETMQSVRAATVEFEKLRKDIFPDLRLGLLHGKIKGAEKEEIMEKMKEGKIDILVATPVVEVGIDFPNATIMLIEAAERFGLAQLHQLRGRVGRGDKQSYCLLFTDSKSDRVQTRLRAMERNLSGAKLAQLDLEMRGPGEVYGSAQSGFPELKIGSYTDLPLIKKAREVAERLLPSVEKDEKLKELLKKQDFIVPN